MVGGEWWVHRQNIERCMWGKYVRSRKKASLQKRRHLAGSCEISNFFGTPQSSTTNTGRSRLAPNDKNKLFLWQPHLDVKGVSWTCRSSLNLDKPPSCRNQVSNIGSILSTCMTLHAKQRPGPYALPDLLTSLCSFYSYSGALLVPCSFRWQGFFVQPIIWTIMKTLLGAASYHNISRVEWPMHDFRYANIMFNRMFTS